MAIPFLCPQCKASSQVKDEYAGKSIRCKCGQVSVIGATAAANSPKPTAAPISKPLPSGVKPASSVPAKGAAKAPTTPLSGGLFGLSDDVWKQVNTQREAEEKRAAEKAAPVKKEANPYMTNAGGSESRIEHKSTDEIRKAQGILAFVGLLTLGLNIFLFVQAPQEVADVVAAGGEVGLEAEALLNIVRIIYGAFIGLGVIFLVLAGLMAKFPLFCGIAGLSLYLLSNLALIAVDPMMIIRGIIIKVFIVIGLTKACIDAFNLRTHRKSLGK